MANTQELVSLVHRLEVVVSKLEGIHGGGPGEGQIEATTALLRQELSNKPGKMNLDSISKVIDLLEKTSVDGQVPCEDAPESPSIAEFDAIVSNPFSEYVSLSKQIGGIVAEQSQMVDQAVVAQRAFLVMAGKSKKPSDTDLITLLKPTSDKISEIQNFREKNRRSEYFNHLSAISESIPALGWVTISPAPAPFIKEMHDAGQFYTNRVLKDFKAKSKVHVQWVKAWINFLSELQAFVKKHHTTGLLWNPKGGSAKAAIPTPAAGGPPPPPPPPPPGFFDDLKAADTEDDKKRNALLDDLNRGEDVTKGLRKVTAQMQTHKNPELRKKSPVRAQAPKVTTTRVPPPKTISHPPKFELDGKKWIVEYQQNNHNLMISNAEVKQSVYMYKCDASTLKITGKCNNLILDSCKKTAVIFDSVVSSCEFINCQSVQMQVLGKVPTITVEKTDGCQMYLSKDSLNVEIVSGKSSEMNVCIPDGDEIVEQPIPEQFRTTINGTKLTTVPTELV